MNKTTRKTPHQLRRSNSSPEHRMADAAGSSATESRDPRLSRPLDESERLNGENEEPRLALSPVIDQTINVMNEREEQRHKLVNTLIVVQLLITGAVAAGYYAKPGFMFPVMLGSLGIYLVAFFAGFILSNDRAAIFLLVFGGGLAVAAQVIAATLTGNPEEIGHIALFFLAVMVEAGLLVAPELVVVLAMAAGGLTGGLLLFITFVNNVSGSQIYLIILYTLSPMALIGILSWLLAHYIYTTTVNVQHAQDLEFRQAHFQQMKTHERERQRELDGSIGSIQLAIAQAITGDYTVRVPVSTGDLEVVEESLNLLLDNFQSLVQAQQENARMTGAMGPLTDRLNQMNDAITPVNVLMTDTPLDNVSVMVTRITESYTRKLNRMQEQLARVSSAVVHSRDGLAHTINDFAPSKGQAGALISRTEAVKVSLQKQLDLLAKARQMMALMLPREITQSADVPETGNADLRGLGIGVEPGLTHEFEALEPVTPAEAGLTPMTQHLPAIDGDLPSGDSQPDSGDGSGTGGSAANVALEAQAAAGEIPAELVEVWHLLLQVGEELSQQERIVAAFTSELGVLSKNVRNADHGMAWTLSALDAIQRSSESSARHPLPNDAELDGQSQPSGSLSMPRSGPSRPLWPESSVPTSTDQQIPRGSLSGAELLGGTDGGDVFNSADLSMGDPDEDADSGS